MDPKQAIEQAIESLEAVDDGQVVDSSGHLRGMDRYEMQKLARAALTALRGVRVEVGWRPIETAPKDGTDVLLWEVYGDVPIVAFWNGEWISRKDHLMVRGDGWVDDCIDPTHWMPLPAEPEGRVGRYDRRKRERRGAPRTDRRRDELEEEIASRDAEIRRLRTELEGYREGERVGYVVSYEWEDQDEPYIHVYRSPAHPHFTDEADDGYRIYEVRLREVHLLPTPEDTER